MKSISVLVGDSQPLFASSLATAISTLADFDLVQGRPESWGEAMSSINGLWPDVALLDLWLQGSPFLSMDKESRRVQEGLRTTLERTGCKLIVLSWMQSREHIRAALEAGAVAFLTKSTTAGDLFGSIRKAHIGKPLIHADELFLLVERMEEKRGETERIMERLGTLSPAELEVLIQLALGRSPGQIAEALYVSKATVKGRIHSILSKTGTRSREQVLADARRCGLIQT